MVEDSELLHRFAREGDQSAFGELVTRHVDRAYAVALRQVGGDTHLAEDVTQIVFTTFAHKAASLVDHPALSAWIHRTAHHAAIDAVRTEARRRAREEKAHAMHELHHDAACDAEWEQLRPDLDAVLAELPERDRAAVALRFFEARAFAEIGRRLGLSEDAARMRVDRALEKMRGLLARRGITCTAAVLGGVLAAPTLVAAPSGLAAAITTAAFAASAGATSGIGLGAFVPLMSSTKFVTGVAAAIVALAVGTGMLDTRVQRSAAAATARMDAEAISAVTAELQTVEERSRALSPRSSSTTAVVASVAPANPAPLDREELGRKFLEDHPDVHQAFIQATDASNRMKFAGLFRELGLSPEQIGAFLALQRPWSGTFGGPWGPGGTSVLLRPGPKSTRQERDRQFESLLGPDGFRRYEEYVATSTVRERAMRAAAFLAFDEEPLSAGQIEELTRSIQAHSHGNLPGTTTQYAWQTILEDVGDVLTPAQLVAIDYLHADDAFRSARREVQNSLRP